MPSILLGLDRALPADIAFTCLNPGLGTSAQPEFLAAIARHRKVIAVPWLEDDHQLWNFQPRVALVTGQVKLAAEQRLAGVAAIHWRTRETELNFHVFAGTANAAGRKYSLSDWYKKYLEEKCGPTAAQILLPHFIAMDTATWRKKLWTPEFYAYTPLWGRLDTAGRHALEAVIAACDAALAREHASEYRKNLAWYRDLFSFELLLDRCGRAMESAWNLWRQSLSGLPASARTDPASVAAAAEALRQAPVAALFRTFAQRVGSRGELGELSAINQKLWGAYEMLRVFIEEEIRR